MSEHIVTADEVAEATGQSVETVEDEWSDTFDSTEYTRLCLSCKEDNPLARDDTNPFTESYSVFMMTDDVCEVCGNERSLKRE